MHRLYIPSGCLVFMAQCALNLEDLRESFGGICPLCAKETSLLAMLLLRATVHTGGSPRGIYLVSFCFLSQITALKITIYYFI